ncbi:MAG: ABC transporter ATP-binding protein, partial [Bacteroidota bacterium]|nr:ABC transporter ATP-binding protein [Bacteroidota bacterium]
MNEKVIEVKSVTKKYQLYDSPVDRLKEALHPLSKKYHRDFFAIHNISMGIHRGQSVGIIGMNGSGKSTILQIIAGVLTATSGNVEVRGRVAALLELGGGFNPEFTGMENIHFQCSIMGIPSQERDDFIHNILDFAEIGDFAHQPVKTYSSGMYVRLAFSIAVNVQPEILIVDEALAVGDAYFQSKCMEKIREFKKSGGTLLFVSHDPGAVKTLCDHTYLLHKGKVVDSGKPNEVFNHYNSLLALQSPEYDNEPLAKKKLRKRSGNNK